MNDTQGTMDDVRLTPKVWTARQVSTVTLFGGILGGFFMISQNAKLLGQYRLAKSTLVLGIILNLAWPIVIALTWASLDSTAGYFFFLPAIAAESVVHFGQKNRIKQLLSTGGKKQPFGKVVLYILLSIPLCYGLGFGALWIFQATVGSLT